MKTYEVAHILLATRHEAEDVLRKLNQGESFENLARKFSQCSSAPQGGHLGLLKLGQADSDFEEAALALSPETTRRGYVKTRFGYHIIKRLK